MLTFDFPKSVYELFLAEVPEPQRAQITQALSRQPFKITLGDEGPVVTIVGEIGDKVFTNENESYRPFVAEEFVKDFAPLVNPPEIRPTQAASMMSQLRKSSSAASQSFKVYSGQ